MQTFTKIFFTYYPFSLFGLKADIHIVKTFVNKLLES